LLFSEDTEKSEPTFWKEEFSLLANLQSEDTENTTKLSSRKTSSESEEETEEHVEDKSPSSRKNTLSELQNAPEQSEE